MSDPDWRAVLIGRNGLTVWPMLGDQRSAAAETLPPDALGSLPGPVIAAGLPVPPATVPTKPEMQTTHVPGLPHIAAIQPLSQTNPAARTSGAETAIAGYLSQYPDFDGILLVLGEETCWVHVSAKEVVSFQTFLTPELITTLGSARFVSGPAFDTACGETLARPERLAQHLASARASATGQESAHLIGAEIAAAKPYWLGQNVMVLAEKTAARPYVAALQSVGAQVGQSDLEAALLAGFVIARQNVST